MVDKALAFPFLLLEPFGGIPQKVSKLLPNSRTVIIDAYSFVVDRRMRRFILTHLTRISLSTGV